MTSYLKVRQKIYFKQKLFLVNYLVNFVKKGFWQRGRGLTNKHLNLARNSMIFIGRSLFNTPMYNRARYLIYNLLTTSSKQLRLIFKI